MIELLTILFGGLGFFGFGLSVLLMWATSSKDDDVSRWFLFTIASFVAAIVLKFIFS